MNFSNRGRLGLHLIVFLTSAALLFARRDGFTFNGLDGTYLKILALQQAAWLPFGTELSLSPFQGMGNVFFPFNLNLVPILSLQSYLLGDISDVASYVAFAGELFLATYLIGRLCSLDQTTSLVAAWLLPIAALAMGPGFTIYPLYGLEPHMIDQILAMAIFLALLKMIRTKHCWLNLAAIGAISIIPSFLAAQNPLTVMVIVPATAGFALAISAASDRRATLLWRAGALVSAAVVALVSGAVEFLIGNTSFTVPSFFSEELIQVQAVPFNVSIAFQIAAFGKAGLILVAGGGLGAVLSLFAGPCQRRLFAIVLIALSGIIICGGLFLVFFAPFYRGPQAIYFETALWPFYAVYLAHLIVSLGRRAGLPGHWTHGRGNLFVLMGGMAVILFGAFQRADLAQKTYEIRETPLTAVLKREIALSPGDRFKGLAATFTGIAKPSDGLSWIDLHAYDTNLVHTLGNDHRFVGLWQDAIPTLQEYSHYTTPSSYFFFSRLLARPQDRQIRTITVLTRPNVSLLRALGVRHVISDAVLSQPARRVAEMPVLGGTPLYLFEIPAPNLGDLSPCSWLKAESASEALRLISEADLQTQVVVAEPLPESLNPARNGTMHFSAGRVRIRAEATDKASVLVLPLQYSRCLRIIEGNAESVRLFRANLIQTGILFSGTLDVTLSLANGPLTGRGCRLDDWREMRDFGLAEAARDWPLNAISPE